MKKLYGVGMGPGDHDSMTIRADRVLRECDVIVGYTVYVELAEQYYPEKEFLTTPMRRETERPEAIAAGTAKLAGVEKDTIVKLASELLDDPEAYAKMAKAVNPYGDGHASARIADAILWHFGMREEKPADFCAE